jgi:2-aminobenzoate-CoA ligase
MTHSAHRDTFARDNLPPRDQWPEFVFDLPELAYPTRLNAAVELLDRAVERGWGARTAIVAPDGTRWTYAQLTEQANRIAHVLVDDLGLITGNRVLLRGPNTPWMAACWFAVLKAGGIAVATMPMLRAKELTDIVTKAEISHALCDARLGAELAAARAGCPTLTTVAYFQTDAPDGVEARAAKKRAQFAGVDTAADDTALIAFTSGTTGKPKGTMHFHRDLLAACDCWPRSMLRVAPGDLFTGSPPLAFTFGLGGLLLFPLRYGASTLLLEKPAPDALLAAIAQYRPTVLVTAPTSYRAMALRAGDFDLSSLKRCVSAGEALPAATRKLWEDASGVRSSTASAPPRCFISSSRTTRPARSPAPTGVPVPGLSRVRDGRLGPAVAAGTGRAARRQGANGCRYLADERQLQYVKGGWNYTGDAYLVDSDGYFVYQARHRRHDRQRRLQHRGPRSRGRIARPSGGR